MDKTLYSNFAGLLTERIRELRKDAGINQRELAKRLDRDQTMVGRIELGERRVDFVEFFWIVKALDGDPIKESGRLMRLFSELQENQNTDQRTA